MLIIFGVGLMAFGAVNKVSCKCSSGARDSYTTFVLLGDFDHSQLVHKSLDVWLGCSRAKMAYARLHNLGPYPTFAQLPMDKPVRCILLCDVPTTFSIRYEEVASHYHRCESWRVVSRLRV
jgi:hypothetical protein